MPISKDTVIEYAAKYDARVAGKKDETVEKQLREWFETNKFLDKDHFMKLCMWKTPRQKPNYNANDEHTIISKTRDLYMHGDHQKRIESLDELSGVGYPVASAILHYCFPDIYSIIDFRAIEALGWEQPSYYTYAYWEKYFIKIQEIAKTYGLSIRTVDKALWEWSKEHSKKAKHCCWH